MSLSSIEWETKFGSEAEESFIISSMTGEVWAPVLKHTLPQIGWWWVWLVMFSSVEGGAKFLQVRCTLCSRLQIKMLGVACGLHMVYHHHHFVSAMVALLLWPAKLWSVLRILIWHARGKASAQATLQSSETRLNKKEKLNCILLQRLHLIFPGDPSGLCRW